MECNIQMEPICRVCLQEENDEGIMVDILSDEVVFQQKNIRALLEECGNIKVERDDPYPKFLCDKCSKHLLVAASFRVRCVRTQSVLQQKHLNCELDVYIQHEENEDELCDFNLTDDDIEWWAPADGVQVFEEDGTLLEQEEAPQQNQVLQNEAEQLHCATDQMLVPANGEELDNFNLWAPVEQMEVAEAVQTILPQEEPPNLDNATEQQQFDNEQMQETLIEECGTTQVSEIFYQTQEEACVVNDVVVVDVVQPHTDMSAAVGTEEVGEASFMNDLLVFSNVNSSDLVSMPENTDDINDGNKAASIISDELEERSETPETCRYDCDECGACFTLAINLKRHMQNSHSKSEVYTCTQCLHCFTRAISCAEHMKTCTHVVQPKHSKIASKTNNGGSNICPTCGKANQSPSALAMHMRTHNGDRPFQCSICKKSFKTKSAVMTHMSRHGPPKFACTVCNKKFHDNSNLSVHMLVHTGEKPHVCKVCNKRFGRVSLLEVHMRIHNGERPYICDLCDRAFAQRCDLRNHMMIHTDNRKHKCPMCSKNFTKRNSLMRHIESHSKVDCTESVPTDSTLSDSLIEYAPDESFDEGQYIEELTSPAAPSRPTYDEEEGEANDYNSFLEGLEEESAFIETNLV